MKKHLPVFVNFSKGIFIGVGALIPGISGGTTAIVLGVFEDILASTANFFKNVKFSLSTLFPIGLGGIVGIFLFAKQIKTFCDNFPISSKYLFILLSFISIIIFAKKSFNKNQIAKKAFFVILGIFIAVITSNLNFFGNGFHNPKSFSLFLIGCILALALILPAISFSYMLYYFGIYELTLKAISEFNIHYLFPLGLGLCVGIIIFSKALLGLINKHSQQTYSFVFGFVIFSLFDLII